MTSERFTNREIELMFKRMDERFVEVNRKLDEHAQTHTKILAQVTYTNGKLKRVTVILIVVATVTATILATNGSDLVDFVLKII